MNGTKITVITIVFMVIFLSITFPMLRPILENESVFRIDTFKGEEQEYIKMKEIPPIASRAISKIEKMKPGNASIINTTNVNLTWTMSGVQNEKMNFSVYVGESKESMVERTTSNYTYKLENLNYNKTYFWKIVPENHGDETISESPLYSFTVMKDIPSNTSTVEETDYLPIILAIALLIFIIIAYVFMRRQRREEEKEMQELDIAENHTIDAEIEHVPEPGKARSAAGIRAVYDSQTHGSIENPSYQQEQIMPVVEDEVKAASVISLIKAMEMLRQRTAAAKQRDDFDFSNIHLPTEKELDHTADEASEEILALPAPKLIEVKKEQQKVQIDELFLITPSGLLVQHYSLERESGLNEDVLAGMLTAVKSFISDSLSLLDKSADRDSEINRIDFGKYSVLMYSGKTLSLVGITSHEEKERIMDQLKKCLAILEDRYGHIIKDWDGDTSKVEDIKPCIEQMVRGELDTMEIADD